MTDLSPQEPSLVKQKQAPVLHGACLAWHCHEVKLGQRLPHPRPGRVKIKCARRKLHATVQQAQTAYRYITFPRIPSADERESGGYASNLEWEAQLGLQARHRPHSHFKARLCTN